jgi:tRNA threonylcarbamoyladenosine biosynthesis protein TsaE
MNETVYTVNTPADFSIVIDDVLSAAQEIPSGAALIALAGDLGAGKTTFTQQLAAQLGVTETVVSPTFGILKKYDVPEHSHFDTLFHIDAYRIEHISEAGPLRLDELFLTPRTLVCLEWPEQIAEILPAVKMQVQLEITENESRKVTITLPKTQ